MMKKILFLVTILLVLASCQQAPEKVTVDVEAEKAALENLFQVFMDGIYIDRNIEIMDSLMTEDVLTCGSDPSEFWNKEETINGWNEMMSMEQVPEMEFFGDRIIKIGPDGKSAIAVDQFYIPFLPNIPGRNVYYLVKDEGNWKISFMSIAVIPKNEDLEAISKAVTVEEEPVEE